MLGWNIHIKAYGILGLNTTICHVIDNIVDKEPPKAKEVFTSIALDEKLPIHFGFRKTDFPYMYNYIARKYGLEGAKCLLAHFILDQIENTLKKGYTHEMIKDVIIRLLEDYKKECKSNKEPCIDYTIVFNEIEQQLSKHVDTVIKVVEKWVKERTLPIETLVNASTEILSLILRINLHLQGYTGKRGFRVDREAFTKTYNKAKHLLKQKIFQAILDNEITNPDKIIESINKIKQQEANKQRITVGEYLDLIKQEQQRNNEFNTYIKIVKEIVKQVIEELQFCKSCDN